MLISFSREDGQCTSQNLRGTTCAQQKQRGERGERELEESVSFALHREILLFFAEDSLNSIAPGPQEEPKSAPKCQIRVVYIFRIGWTRNTRLPPCWAVENYEGQGNENCATIVAVRRKQRNLQQLTMNLYNSPFIAAFMFAVFTKLYDIHCARLSEVRK